MEQNLTKIISVHEHKIMYKTIEKIPSFRNNDLKFCGISYLNINECFYIKDNTYVFLECKEFGCDIKQNIIILFFVSYKFSIYPLN